MPLRFRRMDFLSFISQLQEKLKEPLPGIEAQKLMLPVMEQSDRFDMLAREHAIPGAVLILFYPDHEGTYFPLIQRPVYEGAHSGQVALPGGKYDPGDRDYKHTALREAQEEIGVKAEEVNIIGRLTELFIPVSNFLIYPYIGFTRIKPVMTPEPREVDEIIFAQVNKLFHSASFKQKEITVRSQQLLAPYFDYQGKMIWGATAMILAELYVVLKELL